MSASFVKMWRGEAGDELISANPLAFCMAAVIARRARWSEGFNVHNLKPGEAFIGDCKRCGMSEQQYRTAKAQLEKWGFATFKPTNKGTVAKLIDTRLFSVLPNEPNGQDSEQVNGRLTDGSRTGNGRVTTNYNGKERKAGQESQEDQSQALAIYEAYPRHVAKPQGLKAIAKALVKVPFEQLLAKTEAYAAHCRQTGLAEQYVPHPATWFNSERFNDALPIAIAAAAAPVASVMHGTLTSAERVSAEKEVQRIDERMGALIDNSGDIGIAYYKEPFAEYKALAERKKKLLAALELKL